MTVAVFRGMAMTRAPTTDRCPPHGPKMIGVAEGFEEPQAAGQSRDAAPPFK
jgi:hypothetical protein